MKVVRTPDLIARQVVSHGARAIRFRRKSCRRDDELRKLYGNFGYIDFVGSPDPEVVANGKNQIDLTMEVDEGHQFFVRRIVFRATTRRAISHSREMLIDEGRSYTQSAPAFCG